ncbi:PREDICTED: uncharacterized protein LOC107171286 [Diuraphis noxia]|uniref:uncharacterized protein LOC107171286 n=1 Tax=Diuraphis noxia TaxID=143948 RepID=UPI0007639CFF|nr:PREDICTED: uncharacterized protein LOC107171286 [Diuraphis noxia]
MVNSIALRIARASAKNRNKNIYYSIENGKIQTINEDYRDSTGVDNDFEIKLLKHSIAKEHELNNNVPNNKYNAVKTICSKENDSSIASQSQHNELLEDRTQKSIAIEKHEIEKRQKAIKLQELELAMQNLDLEYMKQVNDIAKQIEDLKKN